MTFTHPLARVAQVVSTGGIKGEVMKLLVIITKLHLDSDDKKYKGDMIKKLSDAAAGWIDEHPDEAVDFILMNRPKKWAGDKD